MKIGRYNREIIEYAKRHKVKSQDMKILLLLNEVMWMHKEDIQRGVVIRRSVFLTSMDILMEKQLIKVARRENAPKGITRMYCITSKGRVLADGFINHLNSL